MKRELRKTADGSYTIYLPDWDESYHSRHGAIQEAYHVFIKNGLDLITNKEEVNILEIGYGTGLNALITLLESSIRKLKINYHGIEKYPVSGKEFHELEYFQNFLSLITDSNLDTDEFHQYYHQSFECKWEEWERIKELFRLKKTELDFLDLNPDPDNYDLIYFDAFGARVQPELWTETLFEILYKSLKSGGILTTYSAKGSVRRALQSVGFTVEKRPGPPGKREMLVAFK